MEYMQSEVSLDASAVLLSALSIVSNGGNKYYEKVCETVNKTYTDSRKQRLRLNVPLYFFEMDYLQLKIQNTSFETLDSVVAYFYFEASEEDIDQCNIMFSLDICQTVDLAGFNKACSNDKLIQENLLPEKVDESYNKENKTYTWALPIVIDSLSLGSGIRVDIVASSGTKIENKCLTYNIPTEVDISQSWSLTEHSITDKEPIYYAGAPSWDKDELTPAPKPPTSLSVARQVCYGIWPF